jgi:hypothetical protein
MSEPVKLAGVAMMVAAVASLSKRPPRITAYRGSDAQNALGKPASFRMPFAVCRDLMWTGTTIRFPSGVVQMS